MKKTYILRNELDAQRLAGAIKSAKIDKPLLVTAEPYRKRRSVAQNRLNFLWCDVVRKWLYESGQGQKDASGEAYAPFTVETVHEYNKELFLTPRRLEVNGRLVTLYRSRDLPVVEFSQFLNEVEAHWIMQGCALPRPEDLYAEAMRD